MVRVAPINLAYNPRTLWFDPGDLEVRRKDAVVVETARGVEFGRAADDVIDVSDADIKALKSPLKRVIRLATAEDEEKSRELEQKSREALPAFKEMVAEAGVDMHPVSVEFLLDGDKAVFYFEAEERVDFRDLVRKLAAKFHVRIDMRQIGVRDEARMVGGLGHCGQELCCKRMGGDFNPVSIRMAKEQDLSLNPQKISGLCGRLMCCLRYEYDVYKEFKSRAPKAGATVQTPEGPAKVVELDVPREVVSLRVEGEKPVRVPLASFDEPKEGVRPSSVGEDAWLDAKEAAAVGGRGEQVVFMTSQFTGSDKLAEAGSVRHTAGGKGRKSAERASAASGSKTRGKATRGGKGGAAAEKHAAVEDTRKPRRRRSTKIAAGEARTADEAAEKSMPKSEGKPRRSRNRSHAVEGQRAASDAPKRAAQGASSEGRDGQVGAGKTPRAKDGARGAGARRSQGVRPGQKSSGLSRGEGKDGKPRTPGAGAPGEGKADKAPRAAGDAQSGAPAGEGAAPRRRRRSRKPRGDGQSPERGTQGGAPAGGAGQGGE